VDVRERAVEIRGEAFQERFFKMKKMFFVFLLLILPSCAGGIDSFLPPPLPADSAEPPYTYAFEGVPVSLLGEKMMRDFGVSWHAWVANPLYYRLVGVYVDPDTLEAEKVYIEFSKPSASPKPKLMTVYSSAGEIVPEEDFPSLLSSAREAFKEARP
jgi:hypothetical protein